MTIFEKWNNMYKDKRCSVAHIQELFKMGEITLDEFITIVGREPDNMNIEDLKKSKIKFIESYKHQARLFFEYGNVGGVQRFTIDDISCIELSIKSLETLEDGSVIEWKYSNGKYENANTTYLKNMLVKGSILIQKAFSVEKKLIETINNISSITELQSFNEKEEFDKLFSE